MLLNLADEIRMSWSKVRENLDRIVEVEIELATLGAFLRTVRYEVVSLLAPDNITRICGEDDVFI